MSGHFFHTVEIVFVLAIGYFCCLWWTTVDADRIKGGCWECEVKAFSNCHHIRDRPDKITHAVAIGGMCGFSRTGCRNCRASALHYERTKSPILFDVHTHALTLTHTEQTTQPLVMHSFVTSNSLPLGYEAQHRMSERDTKAETTKWERDRIVHMCRKR